jgi:hypothetical protein
VASSSSSAVNPAPAGAANAAAPPLSALVFETLARDASFRTAGVVDDLIPFDQVQFGRRWDSSLPTLVTELTYSKTRVQRATQAAFVKKFHAVFPELQELDWRNFVVAGGAVGHLLVSNDAYDGDVDFFVYGVDKETADLRARALVKALVANRKKLMEDANKQAPPPQQQMMMGRGGYNAFAQPSYAASLGGSTSFDLKIIRNANGLSVFIDRRVYQIIFRIYASVSEIIHGFDIGSSAVAFDGKTVFFTSLSKLSYEFMINVVDTTRRSTTYEARLEKYLRRGFQIVLPHFDIAKLRTDYHAFGLQEIIMIPHLKVTYTKVSGNQIVVQTFLRFGADNETKAQTTDYQLDDIDEYNLLYINMHHLLSDPTKLYFFWEHEIDLDGKKKTKKGAKKQPKKKRRGDDDDDDDDDDGEDGDGEDGDGEDGGEDDDEAERIDEDGDDDDDDDGDDDAEEDDSGKGRKRARRDRGAKKKAAIEPVDDDNVAIDRFFAEPPFLSTESVNFFYDTLRSKVFEKKQLQVGALEKYVNVQDLSTIMRRIYIEKEDINAVLDDVFVRQRAHVLALLQQHASQPRVFPWITTDPGTQLTSSINPIIAEPQDWYGTYYLQRK